MLNPEKNKYQLYSFTSADFKKRLFDSGIAKVTVGVATVNYWAWSDACRLYHSNYSGKTILLRDKKVKLPFMSDKVLDELISLYAIVLQERVIGAIKHMENGSNGYLKYGLERLASGNDWNIIMKELSEIFPFMSKPATKAEADLYTEILHFFKLIPALFGRDRLNLFSEFSKMYSHYNGGKPLSEELNPEIKNTSFYNIVKIIDDWKNECKVNLTTGKTVSVEDPF